MRMNELSYEELIILKQALVSLQKYGCDPYSSNYDKEIKAASKVEKKIDSAILDIEAYEDEP